MLYISYSQIHVDLICHSPHYIQNLNYYNHPVSYSYVLIPPACILAIQGCNCLSQINGTFIPIITYLSINCFHHSCLQKPKNSCLCIIFDHYCQTFTYRGEAGHLAVSLTKFCPILPNFLWSSVLIRWASGLAAPIQRFWH